MTKDALDDFPSKQEILKAISDAVYSQYPKKEWQGLSDDELDALNGSPMALEYSGLYKFARAIEQALKEKNNAL
jgi:hypothetical protein